MKNGDMPAMPSGVLQDGHNCGHYPLNAGLTKREMFAMEAMKGLLAGRKSGVEESNMPLLARDSCLIADYLLAELERTK